MGIWEVAEVEASVRETVIVGERGRLTVPQRVRERVPLEAGQVVQIEVVDENTMVLRVQAVVDRDQAWMLKPEWQERVAAGLADIQDGRTTVHASDEAFLDSLD